MYSLVDSHMRPDPDRTHNIAGSGQCSSQLSYQTKALIVLNLSFFPLKGENALHEGNEERLLSYFIFLFMLYLDAISNILHSITCLTEIAIYLLFQITTSLHFKNKKYMKFF